jgi:restriction system protein
MEILYILLGSLFLVFMVWGIVDEINKKKKRLEREHRIKQSGIYEVDRMTGEMFEEYLQFLFTAIGYQAHMTSTSGDYGADLILTAPSKIIVVQAKRYKNKVGLKAVQEIVSAKRHYGAMNVGSLPIITSQHQLKT